jgi:hypothetical protein
VGADVFSSGEKRIIFLKGNRAVTTSWPEYKTSAYAKQFHLVYTIREINKK